MEEMTEPTPVRMNDLTLRPLEPADAPLVADLIASQPSGYLRFFYAFGSDEAAIAEILCARERDVYSGMFWEDRLVSIFMLRGWDAGFETPTFGVIVCADHRGREVGRVVMEAAKTISRLSGAKRIMAKIHPDNIATTRGGLREGFVPTSEVDASGNIIYYLELE